MRKVYLFFIILGAAFSTMGLVKPSLALQKVLREAENLSLNHDRMLATNVLQRNLKKANEEDSKFLREKLLQLSKLFYTDEGFRAYLSGKELFDQQKYSDSADKLHEADELEKGNIDVLHLLTLAELQLKKSDLAWAIHKRAIQMCPIDVEIQKDALALLAIDEKWTDVLEQADQLIKDQHDTSAQTLKERGVALFNQDVKSEARKAFEAAVQRDPEFPESYYWLSLIKERADTQKLLTKYIKLCKNKTSLRYEREAGLCAKLSEAEKRLTP